MVYLFVPIIAFGIALLLLKQRRFADHLRGSADDYYLDSFEAATLASKRGLEAEQLRREHAAVANDREHFLNICYGAGVKPELAARAWVDRALSRAHHQGKP